ncbi:MAG: hypothetical protein J1E85_07890 [Ruminococcus sp.]|nr:hypothetical protein [Ruminococcus sp.]
MAGFEMVIYKINCIKNNTYKEFGIDAFENGLLIKSVEGITDIFDDITQLKDMCNELEIEICHLDDIIEDYLTDFRI